MKICPWNLDCGFVLDGLVAQSLSKIAYYIVDICVFGCHDCTRRAPSDRKRLRNPADTIRICVS